MLLSKYSLDILYLSWILTVKQHKVYLHKGPSITVNLKHTFLTPASQHLYK